MHRLGSPAKGIKAATFVHIAVASAALRSTRYHNLSFCGARTYIAANQQDGRPMQPFVRLKEEHRTSRRTIADALDVVGQDLAPNEVLRAQIRIVRLRLPSGNLTALVDVVFADLGYIVSLPTSAQFKALSDTSSRHQVFEISRLDGAEVCADGSVRLADGTQLRAVEVIPTHLPYKLSKLEETILQQVISLTRSDHCYRSIREGLPEHLQHQVPDLRAIDYSRVSTIQAPLLKEIPGYNLQASNQKISDALATLGIRKTTSTGGMSAHHACHNLNWIATILLVSKLLTLPAF
jgi:hypothetical protein